ncbi:TIGR04104 family putative zinc finger protein [Pallidibacillus pasinlerensis]|uniref:Cxxc_20_cxxc protein n=1 Tax=Pallidibacillus pasinlerensis TaxID=2703818 RepID=A0ABX0AD59_9BACI|nr:TIGR04104 family putative zinc finger protein [Pallidibacillus pasinlerensis]NCU19088.1 hypothetical protein [Pallidibacillus pasinlerensis]
MQKCNNCNTPFNWRIIFKSFWWIYKPIECDTCGTEHKITLFGRSTIAAMSILPIWIFGYILSPTDNIFVLAGIGLLMGIIDFLLSPYIVRYKKMNKYT